MTHMHADDKTREIVHAYRHSEGESEVFGRYREIADALRHSEGAGMDDWHDTLAPGFEKPRPWRIDGPMFGAAVLMASATILCLAVIGLLALIFPGAFA